ncbi:MAG: family 16 glycosylhydrolase [Salinivirgaceae bacterium]
MKSTYLFFLSSLTAICIFNSCNAGGNQQSADAAKKSSTIEILTEAENTTDTSDYLAIVTLELGEKHLNATSNGSIALDVDIPVAGRYVSQIRVSSDATTTVACWVEDYYNNTDERTYNITGNLEVHPSGEFSVVSVDGSPLNKGIHKMKVHFNGPVKIDWIKFTLIKEHITTPKLLTQNMEGSEWNLVWADEFDGAAVDTSKWTFDIGDWGWGNFESQYYTDNKPENARIEDGNLIIEAHKNTNGEKWTSARLTTRGKVSFKYGKIEFKAKVPINRGNWAAGWTLGDTYIDEISWPYCGEIDILESVAFERDTLKDQGIAHASVHSRAYYFKIGNQVSSSVPIPNMENSFHTYTLEWTPTYIHIFLNGVQYFTYTKTDVENSWPFDIPQNIILNLAMGGGWGGAKGIDEKITSQKFIIDYVRVYERK